MYDRVKLFVDKEETSLEMFTTFRKTLKKLLSNEYIKHFDEEPCGMNTKIMMKTLRNRVCYDGITKNTDFDIRSVSHIEMGSILAHMIFSVYTMICMRYQRVKRDSYRYNKYGRHSIVRSFLYEFIGVIDDAPIKFHAVDRMTRALDYIDAAEDKFPFCSVVTKDLAKIDAYFNKMWGIKMIDDDDDSE
ncbi:hypothetical protein AR158_C116L [Paramecium bursaria Chlorella virus AR158]|uniref:hypothetical protein n=1 Tax=Paramecium bursaria Chlorella virus AR158 TaxID=380598 RepID=UPI00015AA7BA|nr:hypothetical protein AR158_C116L [Paramecium bursaria Chlorella virus AR158]ABU43662.1 hypothetical protein AR158_C116L [Paramecium bursaria Chlorella virus AR158]